MSDIRKWLQELGLGQYAETFEENALDLAALPHVTDDDLASLGIPLGHRRRIQAANADAASANADAASNDPGQSAVAASGQQEPTPAWEAERRQITVMFCDLVGSTALSEELDPEELRTVMQAYRKACAEVIERYDGHVAQYLGDGVMVYFGWPAAHEDDAQRAVRAGLDIVAVVAALDGEVSLAVRVGISTGLVVVGESGADEGAWLAVGETPNIAARIQGLAQPGSVAIAQSTRRLLGGAFALEDLGSHDAKGVSGGLQAHRVVGAAQTESRFEATQGAVLTPLVGRESEIALLLDRWEQAKDGDGQAVLLSGEAGIGKSRVTQVLRERLSDESHIRLRYQCSPYYTSSAFYPFIDQLERAADFAREDSVNQKLDKLDGMLVQGSNDVARVAPLFASMLSLPIDRYPPLNLSPQRQKNDTIAALAAQVVGLAREEPLLILFEDAHWCDPTSLETLTAVIGAIESASVLLVVTFRPEFEPPWTGHGHVVAQSLSRLGRRQGAAMVANVTGGKALPDEVLDQIVAKTDGIPLFVEELTKTVLEAGYLRDTGEAYVLDGPLPPLAIPVTLQDSLTARLDRLSLVKEVAQIGACIGREFTYELLAAVSPLQDNELQDSLQQLVNSELIYCRGTPPDALYSFKHALVQDSAYESLLKSRRQQLHQQLAETLETRFPDVAAIEPELLALHFGWAGLSENAGRYWLAAGTNSLGTMALSEATAQLKRGLGMVSTLAPSLDRDRIELELRKALGTTLMASVGWADSSVFDALYPAVPLAKRLADESSLPAVLWGIWLNLACRGELVKSLDIIREMDEVAGPADSDMSLVREEAASCTHIWMGEFEKGKLASDRIITHYSSEKHSHITDFTIHDPKAIAFHWGGNFRQWIAGYPERCFAEMDEMMAHARASGHPFNLAFSLTAGSWCLGYCGRLEELMRRCEEAERIAQEQSMGIIEHCITKWLLGLAFVDAADYRRGLGLLRPAMEIWTGIGGRLHIPATYSAMALGLAHTGDPGEAATLGDRAISTAEQKQDRWAYAEVYRCRGEIYRLTGSEGAIDAERCYRRAIEIAVSQDAKSWELRAVTSLAKLLQSQNKRQDAHDLLAPVYAWFTEGFDTPDLKEAKALLDELK